MLNYDYFYSRFVKLYYIRLQTDNNTALTDNEIEAKIECINYQLKGLKKAMIALNGGIKASVWDFCKMCRIHAQEEYYGISYGHI
jgi:hypothetical protein